MGFEKKILDVISPALETGDHAEFYNGTLFLEGVSDKTGKDVYNILVNELGKDKFNFNIYNPVNGFVVDFR